MRRLLLALCALTLLSGCGGGVDASLFATAVRNTEAAGGAEVAFQMTMKMPGVAEPVVMTGTGVEDAKNQRAQLEFDLSSFANVPGVAAVCGDGCGMEMVADGLAFYVRSDLFGQGLGGKEWMKMDMDRIGSSMGVDMGAGGRVGQTATEQLRMLETVSDGITEHGTEQVRGEPTTHYSATIDLGRMPDGDKLTEIAGNLEMPTDVWIDSEDRIRRMEIGYAVEPLVDMRVVVEYVRFGVPVDIDVPDEDDTFDATDLVAEEME